MSLSGSKSRTGKSNPKWSGFTARTVVLRSLGIGSSQANNPYLRDVECKESQRIFPFFGFLFINNFYVVSHPPLINHCRFSLEVFLRNNCHSSYFALYFICLTATFILLLFEPFDLETNLTAATSCFNNIGPAFGSAWDGFSIYSPFAKVVLSFAMLLGRLEIYPLILLLSPSSWLKRRKN